MYSSPGPNRFGALGKILGGAPPLHGSTADLHINTQETFLNK